MTSDSTHPNDDSHAEVNALIARCLLGDQTAYSDLYARYADGIYRLCYSLLLNAQDAEDVAQESFVYAFKNLHRYDSSKSALKTWLYTIALSRCRNMYRRKQPVMVGISQLFQLDLPAPNTETPEAALTRQTARETVDNALQRLSPLLRESVILRYGHGLTYREIAEVMECPQKTAESRVRLAHERLRDLLQATGQGLLEELLSF